MLIPKDIVYELYWLVTKW